MKYIITESKLNSAITEYLNELYDIDDIHWTHPYTFNDETGEEYEDPNLITYYRGDYDGPFDSDFVFQWIDPEHYEGYIGLQRKCPILEVHDREGEILDSYFGDKWHEPFRIWFEINFEFPVKTVEVGIS